MKAGDRIRVQKYICGQPAWQDDYTVEEFRHCLGIFLSECHRTAQIFTPLCELYEPAPDAKEEYLSNFGSYHTEYVQAWMDLPQTKTNAG